MAAMEHENKIAELKQWAGQVMELLDEVKPYRSVFYKQRVAKLKDEFSSITHQKPALQLKSKV